MFEEFITVFWYVFKLFFCLSLSIGSFIGVIVLTVIFSPLFLLLEIIIVPFAIALIWVFIEM